MKNDIKKKKRDHKRWPRSELGSTVYYSQFFTFLPRTNQGEGEVAQKVYNRAQTSPQSLPTRDALRAVFQSERVSEAHSYANELACSEQHFL